MEQALHYNWGGRNGSLLLALLAGLLDLLDGFLVLVVLGHPCVDHLGTVVDDRLDETLLFQFNQSLPGQRSANLQPLGNDAGSDKLVGRNLLVQFIISHLVEEDQVVELVPGLSLGPLLLGLTAASLLLLGSLGRRLRGCLGILLGSHLLLSLFLK